MVPDSARDGKSGPQVSGKDAAEFERTLRTESRGRPWRWRWLVTVTDLPPMPTYAEVWGGFWTRRSAEHEAKMLRLTFIGHRQQDAVRVDVKRRPRRHLGRDAGAPNGSTHADGAA